MTSICKAIHEGNRDSVLEQLKNGADINKGDEAGITPLMVSISGEKPAIGKLLIERGADVKIANNDDRTALHFAAEADYSNLVEEIISKGCDVNYQDFEEDTALHDAILKESKDSVAVLCGTANLNPGIVNRNGFNALHYSCFLGQPFAVDKILDKHKSLVNVPKSDGYTALHLAAMYNHTDCARILIEKGKADINSRHPEGQTPLVFAALNGCLECVQLLIEKNADVNAVYGMKLSPLHACCFGATSIGDMQLFADKRGISVSADIENRIKIARCLIEKGARTDLKNEYGKTPLECCTDENMKLSLSEFISQSYSFIPYYV